MAINENITGRAGSASLTISIEGLYPALKKWAAADPMFNKEIRKASVSLMNELLPKIQSAATRAPNPRQAIESARGFRARPDRIPIIKLADSSYFVSTTRPNRKRKRKVTRGDVFFGSEFGSDKLRQFPRRSPRLGRGNKGYWFWPVVEQEGDLIRSKYMAALDEITSKMSRM